MNGSRTTLAFAGLVAAFVVMAPQTGHEGARGASVPPADAARTTAALLVAG